MRNKTLQSNKIKNIIRQIRHQLEYKNFFVLCCDLQTFRHESDPIRVPFFIQEYGSLKRNLKIHFDIKV